MKKIVLGSCMIMAQIFAVYANDDYLRDNKLPLTIKMSACDDKVGDSLIKQYAWSIAITMVALVVSDACHRLAATPGNYSAADAGCFSGDCKIPRFARCMPLQQLDENLSLLPDEKNIKKHPTGKGLHRTQKTHMMDTDRDSNLKKPVNQQGAKKRVQARKK